MTDVLKFGKKIFTVGVVATTIVWSLGLAALVPAAANAAADCPALYAGDMVKVTGKPAIYAVNNDLKVLYFPSGDEFKSWQPTYGGYKSITQSCFDSLSVPSTYPGAVNFRAGTYVVKRPSSDQLYVVEPGNTLAKITVDAAKALYGATYKVMTVGDAFWPHYVNRGTDVSTSVVHPGMLVSNGGKNWYVNTDNKLQEVTADGFTANKFQTKFVRPVTDAMIAGLSTGSAITAEVPALTDKTQSGGVVGGVVTGGALTVSLAADTPASRTVADGTIYNDVLKLNLAAGSQAVKVKGITLTKTGLIANNQITGVSVWDKMGDRHGDVMTSLTSDGKVTVSFSGNPILVAANTTETLLVKINLGTTAASSIVGLKVQTAAEISSDGSVGGVFPVEGNQLSVVDGATSLAAFTVANTAVGGITNGTETTATGNMEVGDLQKELAKFRISETSGNEDIVVQRAVFYLEGTIQDKHLKNFKVYDINNNVLGTAETAVDRYVTVKFTNPYTVAKSMNRDLSLRADVVDGSGYYVRVHIQNDYDVMVKGASTGYFVSPTGFVDVKETDGWFKVKGGTLTLNKTSTSPSGNVSAGATSLVLAKFDVKAVGEGMEVRKFGLRVVTSTDAGAIQKKLSGNVIVRDAASGETFLTIAGTDDNLYLGYQYNLSSYINLTSNQTKTIEVVGNIDSTATATHKYTVKTGKYYAKRMSSLDFQDNLGNAAVDGIQANQLTVNTTRLSVYKDTAVGNVNRSKGSTGVVVGQFVAQAGASEDIRLTSVNVKFTGVSQGVALTYQNLELYSGTTLLGSTISSVASSSNVFNFSLDVAKNTSKTLTLKANILSGAVNNDTVIVNVDSYNYSGLSSSNPVAEATDVVGQQVTIKAASATISAVNDVSTASKVYGPSVVEKQLGKWKVEATNEKLTLSKLSFNVRDEAFGIDLTAGNFGTLALYDGVTKLGEANYVNGEVVFTGLNLVIPADGYKILTLNGLINPSGSLNSDSINVFTVKSDDSADLELTAESGGLLAAADINGANVPYATSTFYKFHDAYPTLASVSMATTLPLGSLTPVFKYTVTNAGTKTMTVVSTTVLMTATGMGTGGTIGTWKLYQANAEGNPGTQLAASAAAALTSTTPTSSVEFGAGNDVNSMMDNLTIEPGASMTFIVVADTQAAATGVGTGGTVTLSGKIGGTTGFNGANWNTGGFLYSYTATGAAAPAGTFSASDSYEVLGTTLERKQ